ncbi:MAG: hypothetical protein C4545_05400 [Anaerolineaceae bacterium]|jgi:vacuolar-type H+-ATPase subunit E/Vma4|nr:MAG: hypothetical protein C4545_05400 [Anaerolineaceae bacterium]
MEIDTILDGINKITESQIAEIKQQTDQRIKEILSQSKKETEEIRRNLEQEGRIRLNREVAIIQQQAEMQYLQNISDARQKLIQESLDQVKKALETMRTRVAYKSLLITLAKEAIEDLKPSLGEEKVIIVSIDPKDQELLKGFAADESITIQYRFDLDCWGGCNAFSPDGKVCVYNTLNDRYQKAIPILQQQLSLFFNEKITRVT